MPAPSTSILLCEYRNGSRTNQLTAVLDEVTLTYSVVLQYASGLARPLRRHIPALRVARAWALA